LGARREVRKQTRPRRERGRNSTGEKKSPPKEKRSTGKKILRKKNNKKASSSVRRKKRVLRTFGCHNKGERVGRQEHFEDQEKEGNASGSIWKDVAGWGKGKVSIYSLRKMKVSAISQNRLNRNPCAKRKASGPLLSGWLSLRRGEHYGP